MDETHLTLLTVRPTLARLWKCLISSPGVLFKFLFHLGWTSESTSCITQGTQLTPEQVGLCPWFQGLSTQSPPAGLSGGPPPGDLSLSHTLPIPTTHHLSQVPQRLLSINPFTFLPPRPTQAGTYFPLFLVLWSRFSSIWFSIVERAGLGGGVQNHEDRGGIKEDKTSTRQ